MEFNDKLEEIINELTIELNHEARGVSAAIKLLDEGRTIPFIARYRKDITMGMSDEQLYKLQNLLIQKRKLLELKENSIKKFEEMNVLTPAIREMILACTKQSHVNDIIAPYKSKRKTRAMKAREAGYQKYADVVIGRQKKNIKKEIEDNVIRSGVIDIVAEEISNYPDIKEMSEKILLDSTIIIEDDENLARLNGIKLSKLKPHQVLSIIRAEKDKKIKYKLNVNREKIHRNITVKFNNSEYRELLEKSISEGIKRFIIPRGETAVKSIIKEQANIRAIEVFEKNLENLLMDPPLPPQKIIGIDPGYISGCKFAVIDETGDVLKTGTIYPTPPKSDISGTFKILGDILSRYDIGVIAIGNGTGSIETRDVIIELLKKYPKTRYLIVSEDGASVYSASKIARDEFPKLPVEIRGAISIARRVLDPLAEYVKIDPKSLGVGQYQHDLDNKLLQDRLEFVMQKVVNRVGINLQTCSKEALTYIAGITPKIASNIIDYRENIGFNRLIDLLKVKSLGKKTFEQCVGFLRLFESSELLDRTLIHYDDYKLAKKILADLKIELEDWNNYSPDRREKLISGVKIKNYITENIGSETINDIIYELVHFGEDIRGKKIIYNIENKIRDIDDLKEGMILEGRVSNVTDFGAFIDFGIKQNGLVHISNLSDTFVNNIYNYIKINELVKVEILSIDREKNRISLKLINKL